MNNDPRFAPVCGDARLPLKKKLFKPVASQGASDIWARPHQWDEAALRHMLAMTLDGDQIIVVSNRQPFSHDVLDGKVVVRQPASGLVAALEPVIRACNGTWIASGGGQADKDFVDASDRCSAPDNNGTYKLRRIWLTQQERKGYYDGFSNSGLWPLCHNAHIRPSFEELDWLHYQAVNRKFANAIVREARGKDPIVLVQDYHLALVAGLVRAQLPKATIVSFWHIPWPHAQQMKMCPWLEDLMRGLLGSDIVGFQTQQDARHFSELAGDAGQSIVKGDSVKMSPCGRASRIRDYPISIAWPDLKDFTTKQSVKFSRQVMYEQLSLRPESRVILGIDRFDYTKGIIERLQAFEKLLINHPRWQGVVRFIQIAAPSRQDLKEYTDFQWKVHTEVARINAYFESLNEPPVVFLNSQYERHALDNFYCGADVCLVTSLRDGMNLVCKEFVAARDDEQGVLVLSQFAGASHELVDALIVNPYHVSQVAQSLHQALTMPHSEQQKRMRALRRIVKTANVYRWAGTILADVAKLRSSDSSRSAKPWREPVSSGLPMNASTYKILQRA